MTQPSSDSPTQNKPPDHILSSTGSLSKSSLTSSASSLSPSTSILFSAATNRSSAPTSSNSRSSSSRKGQASIPPLSSSSSNSTNSSTGNAKLESIIQFNITTNDNEKLKEELKFWKSLVKYQQDAEEPPPLVIDIYLETNEPELLQEGDNNRGWHKLDFGIQQNDVQRILIESWTLSLNHPFPDYPVDLPNLYKKSIVFFRSLHSLVRILPGHSLFQRSRLRDGEFLLGYRLSTARSNRKDEVSLDHALTSVDTIQLHEFKELSTPLGTFKVKLLFREHCQFNTQDKSTLDGVDVDENFFTPTMTKYRLENSKEKAAPQPSPLPVFPTASSATSGKSRLQSYRGAATAAATTANRTTYYPMNTASSSTSTSSNNNSNASQLERRISAPLVSPFKSPSLSSSPQAELMFTSHSRSNTPERSKLESESFGRKPEFSSSFEKFFVKGNNSGGSYTSASSGHHIRRIGSCNNESEEDEENLEEFMRFITARQDLKLFQQQTSQLIFSPTAANKKTSDVLNYHANHEDTTRSLSHFRNIQETHAILSDSMTFNQQQIKPQPQQTENSYESTSSSSLTKGLNLPAIPSPLHNTESATHPTAVSGEIPYDRYPTDIVIYSPLKNRQAPPPPHPPKMPIHQTRRISGSGGSGGTMDDDDSLVFKMSELNEYGENAPSCDPYSNNFCYGSNHDDYLQRLKLAAAMNDDGDMQSIARRAASIGGTPNSAVNAVAMCASSDASSKSDPIVSNSIKFKAIQQDQGTKITRRLFYGES
ncbi:hypothetical protein [Parasitella parasitica]|uniref:Autophagy-related protein 13 n=1 Tax=Parasitella parasitica TaxID=35722 RepID=A0A0B7N788_9FUNG|nr:hypothetical protein [Parasitella parasitica]